MTIQEFKQKAVEQDERNVFEKSDTFSGSVPKELQQFFAEANPVDVEVSMKENSVKFYPVSELYELQSEYNLGENCFVFATCNSDPIFMKNKIVYTKYHGSIKSSDEKMADSFAEFLDLID